MKRWLLLGAVVIAPLARAYDAETHELMMYLTYQRSDIVLTGPGSLSARFGFDRLDERTPFSAFWDSPTLPATYYDILPPLGNPILPLAYERQATEYEDCKIGHIGINLIAPIFAADGRATNLTIASWLMRGDLREDDTFDIDGPAEICNGRRRDFNPYGEEMRVFNHFYDPIHDTALNPAEPLGDRSITWALGLEDPFSPDQVVDDSRKNHFTYAEARNDEWQALTHDIPGPGLNGRIADAHERVKYWATTFRSLGNVIHLLQDGAQPQHVRNDAHSPFNNLHRQSYELYTNIRVYPAALPNAYLIGLFGSDSDFSTPVLHLENNYPVPMFSLPIRFFTSRDGSDEATVLPDSRVGMMDYANRSFFTAGTLPGSAGDTFLRPISEINGGNGYTKTPLSCGLSAELVGRMTVSCTHWTHSVTDSVSPTYTDFLPSGFSQPPIIAESVLGQWNDIFGTTVLPRYAMGLEEFETSANLAIPRAIGYGAGLLNYFFRGKLDVTAPPDGLIAVVDQAIPHHMVDGVPITDGGQVYGFTTIRVRAKNTTPNIHDPEFPEAVIQVMKGGVDSHGAPTGKLVAIAKYHRNPCYTPDLLGDLVRMPDSVTGEPADAEVPVGCTEAETRTTAPEISVSAPMYIDEDGNLPGIGADLNPCINLGNINTALVGNDCANAAPLLQFDFSSDPIPINATDLFVQVAYRGSLGDEQDSVAVGTLDVIEPNYATVWNDNDWFLYQGEFIPSEEVPPFLQSYIQDIHTAVLCYGDQRIAELRPSQVLATREMMRIAYISTDLMAPIGVNIIALGEGGFFPIYGYSAQRQALDEKGIYFAPEAMSFFARGTIVGAASFGPMPYYPTPLSTYPSEPFLFTPDIGTPTPGIATPVSTGFSARTDARCSG